VPQSSSDHFAAQLIGVLANGRVRHELVLVSTISIDLLSNIVVEANEPLVRHTFDTHDQLLPQLNAACFLVDASP